MSEVGFILVKSLPQPYNENQLFCTLKTLAICFDMDYSVFLWLFAILLAIPADLEENTTSKCTKVTLKNVKFCPKSLTNSKTYHSSYTSFV